MNIFIFSVLFRSVDVYAHTVILTAGTGSVKQAPQLTEGLSVVELIGCDVRLAQLHG